MSEKSTYEELKRQIQELKQVVSEHKHMATVLRKSKERLVALSVASFEAIFISDKGVCMDQNQAAERIFGYTRAEAVGRQAMEWIALKDREQVKNNMLSGCEEPYEVIALRKDGTTFPAEIQAKMIDFRGRSVRVTALRDITERKQAEKALSQSEEKYKSLTNNLNVGIYRNAIDSKGRIIEANPAMVDMFGFDSKEEFLKRSVSDLYKNPYDREKFKAKILKTGFVRNEELQLQKMDKTSFIGSISAVAAKGKNGEVKYFDGVIEDITERKKAAEALQKSEEKLARSKKMESLGLLAGGVAHDLNNVLAGIVSYPDLILMGLPENSKFRKSIKTIRESGLQAAAIVQDLLTVARGVASIKESLNLNDLICDYLSSPEFKKLAHFHPLIAVKTNLDTDLFAIRGSHIHIWKVVMNLVSNAAEAIDGSGNIFISTVNKYIDSRLRGYDDVNIGEYVMLSVSDNGSGISSDDLERIFEPFYTKKVMGRSGTGLGLAVVWNTLQDHRGYIDVTSDQSGTTFDLYFPITREEISTEELSIPIENIKGDQETILVVDDVKTQRDISCEMLEILAYKTRAVSSGEEAVEYMKAHTIDLILLDMIMDPGINGREAYERIVKIHPGQKAIIVSGFAETDEVRKARKLGVGNYIKKPFTLEEIGVVIKEELKKQV